jgi:hypothetical protein
MSIIININPRLEKHLREQANRTGIELNQLVENVLEKWSEPTLPSGKKLNKNKEEVLLQKINNTGFPESFWIEYRDLIKKRQLETIEVEELAHLVKMSDRLEKANVQRMKYLIALAQIRDITVRDLMQQLGVTEGGR